MKPIAVMLALCFFLTSCATGHHYYDRDQDGTRYYETKDGKKIQVTAGGVVSGEGGQKLGVVQKKGTDWDLSGYEVEQSYSRCIDLFDWDESVPCWVYGFQIPVFFVAILPGLAIVGTYLAVGIFCHPACYISSGDLPSWSQDNRNQGPNRDTGGPGMRGAPSVGGSASIGSVGDPASIIGIVLDTYTAATGLVNAENNQDKAEAVRKRLDQSMQEALSMKDESAQSHALQDIVIRQLAEEDVQGALRAATVIRQEFFKASALWKIVKAQARAGDVQGALATSSTIQLEYIKVQALRSIVEAHAKAGDVPGAIKTAGAIESGSAKAFALQAIAVAQAKVGDVQIAIQTASRIGTDYIRADTLRDIASVQAKSGDRSGALRTTALIKDESITKQPSGYSLQPANLKFSASACQAHSAGAFEQLPPIQKTWSNEATLMITAHVYVNCALLVTHGAYALERNSLILEYGVFSPSGDLEKCGCSRQVTYEITNLNKRDYEIHFVEVTVPQSVQN